MTNAANAANDALEEECEDAVFKICCTREHYSVRCANQLEKYLTLYGKQQFAPVETTTDSQAAFETPTLTQEQKDFLRNTVLHSDSKREMKNNSNNEIRIISNRFKELKNIVRQIKQSKNCEIYEYLK